MADRRYRSYSGEREVAVAAIIGCQCLLDGVHEDNRKLHLYPIVQGPISHGPSSQVLFPQAVTGVSHSMPH